MRKSIREKVRVLIFGQVINFFLIWEKKAATSFFSIPTHPIPTSSLLVQERHLQRIFHDNPHRSLFLSHLTLNFPFPTTFFLSADEEVEVEKETIRNQREIKKISFIIFYFF